MTGSLGKRIQLQRLIKAGKLFDLQAWVRRDRPVRFTYARPPRKLTALDMAVASGFHTMVERMPQEIEWLLHAAERTGADQKMGYPYSGYRQG